MYGSRGYSPRLTLFSVPSGTGPLNIYAYDDDPNGVITWAQVGDRCFQTGANVAWVCTSAGPAVWAVWGAGAGLARTQFVWQPGGTADPTNGIYDDFDDVYDAASAVAVYGIDVEIWVDTSLGAALIPAAEYDMYHVQLVGTTPNFGASAAGARTVVTTSDGTTFLNFTRGTPWIELVHGAATPLFTYDGTGTDTLLMHMGEGAWWRSTVDAPVISQSDGILSLAIDPYAQLGDSLAVDGGAVLCDDPGTIQIRVFGNGAAYSNATLGDGTILITGETLGSTIEDQTLPLGGTVTVSQPPALYVPGTPGDWGSSVPTDVTQALDLIANNLSPVTP